MREQKGGAITTVSRSPRVLTPAVATRLEGGITPHPALALGNASTVSRERDHAGSWIPEGDRRLSSELVIARKVIAAAHAAVRSAALGHAWDVRGPASSCPDEARFAPVDAADRRRAERSVG